jgi:hypothetical protein
LPACVHVPVSTAEGVIRPLQAHVTFSDFAESAVAQCPYETLASTDSLHRGSICVGGRFFPGPVVLERRHIDDVARGPDRSVSLQGGEPLRETPPPSDHLRVFGPHAKRWGGQRGLHHKTVRCQALGVRYGSVEETRLHASLLCKAVRALG